MIKTHHWLLLLAVVFIPNSLLKAQQNPSSQKVITGAVLLEDKNAPDAKKLVAALKSEWKIKADSVNISDKTLVFSTPGATVMVAWLDYPAPAPEVRAAAKLAWLWPTAFEDAPKGQAQVVISVIGTANRTLELYKIFSKTAGAVLEQTRSIGVYMSDQYLLLSKGFYIAAARNLSDAEALPVYCWVYFGMQQKGGLNGGYTYGLKEFGLTEMEIVDSNNSLQDVHSVLYDVAIFLLKWNQSLKEGQTFEGVPDLKLSVSRSKGSYLEEETLKLGY